MEYINDERRRGAEELAGAAAHAGLRDTRRGRDKRRFELFALAASIVGKCEHCVRSHYALLKQEGVSVEQLRDVGRIVAVVAAAANAIAIEEPVSA
jgi:alkyl hydroperoxide reductase subunit D